MVSEIISGVCSNLAREFGEDVKIYTEDSARKAGILNSKAPLRESNFYVSSKNPSNKRIKDRHFTSTQLLGNRYLHSVALCVECRWFENWQDILDRLFICLEYISVGGSKTVIRGAAMQGERVDDLLSFFVNYDVFVYYSEDEKEKMGKLEMEEKLLWH
ncbi:MAG: hypothetical protein FWF94_05490 [Oscillospiraceae bacterium]|nr:hypothetical protein [Oscillospiraceae bacterium]